MQGGERLASDMEVPLASPISNVGVGAAEGLIVIHRRNGHTISWLRMMPWFVVCVWE